MILTLILAATIATKADVPRLSAHDVHALVQKGEAVVLDVRGSVPFKYGHIPGAVSMPLGTIGDRFGELPQDRTIVAYCTCKSEETSLEAAAQLAQQHGFEKVGVLVGGMAAWKGAGFEIVAERATDPPVASAPSAASSSSGRLAPPAAVTCDRNQLTSYAGRVAAYARAGDKVTITLATSAGTSETVTSIAFLSAGQPFDGDWKQIEAEEGKPLEKMSAIAWVCADGTALIDWRPGVTFDGGE